ncbi:TetR/AcrR family transcriptional regulator [Streptomyces sp. TRM 70361]|uniref:TetR/AcrR family transcriptional regulator n=1 Tax=Streptomyces sp. TRM 70361 TaxID=3116553 RepID=UPI002E7B6DCB|nr:TetR/AcrR family transcriptional regulator [Streptomyces sp. TRM 70361]MEE1938716.1 TetR/AcrR family transcriptional regulator [Streptomyces sp. TRM 70361]
MAGSPHRTGRPRSAAADRAILDATRSALVELGWGRLTMGDVAVRAKVAKTTLYRRWANKNDLVVDAVAVLFDNLRLPDRGSLRADVEGVVLSFAELLERPETKASLMAVVAEATRDETLRGRIRTAIVDRQKRLVVEGRRRAQARGELPGDPPGPAGAAEAARAVDLVFDVIAGAVVHRCLVSAERVTPAWARALTTLLLQGLAAPQPPAGDRAAVPADPADGERDQKPAGSV